MLRYRNMILCVLMSIFMVAWMVLGWAFLPLFYVKVRELSAGEMSVLMSLLGLSAAFFSFVVPGLSDRLGRRPVVVAFNLLGVLVPLAALYWHGSLYLLGTLIFVGWAASGPSPCSWEPSRPRPFRRATSPPRSDSPWGSGRSWGA